MSILKSESSTGISNLRDRTNYVFTRALAKTIYYVSLAISIIIPFVLPLIAFANGGLVIGSFFTGLIAAFILFVLTKLTYESFSVILDIGDASVANLAKTNNSKTSISPSLFSEVVDELKKISEKTDKTNAYLHHIYQNSTKAPPPPSS